MLQSLPFSPKNGSEARLRSRSLLRVRIRGKERSFPFLGSYETERWIIRSWPCLIMARGYVRNKNGPTNDADTIVISHTMVTRISVRNDRRDDFFIIEVDGAIQRSCNSVANGSRSWVEQLQRVSPESTGREHPSSYFRSAELDSEMGWQVSVRGPERSFWFSKCRGVENFVAVGQTRISRSTTGASSTFEWSARSALPLLFMSLDRRCAPSSSSWCWENFPSPRFFSSELCLLEYHLLCCCCCCDEQTSRGSGIDYFHGNCACDLWTRGLGDSRGAWATPTRWPTARPAGSCAVHLRRLDCWQRQQQRNVHHRSSQFPSLRSRFRHSSRDGQVQQRKDDFRFHQ